ncbi:MAG: tetratricopeptide repeat protein [Candidatus Zipacnadales bacterium]
MTRSRGYWWILPAVAVLSLVWFSPVTTSQETPSSTDQDFIDGVRLAENQEYSEALTKLQAVVNATPELEAAWHYIGICQFQLGNYQEAAAALQRAIELRPERPTSRLYLGRIYESLGAYQEAITLYEEELRLQIGKQPAAAYNALARGYNLAGRYREAIEAAREALLRDPKYVEALYSWGQAADALGEPRKAMEKLQEARTILLELDDLTTRKERYTQEGKIDQSLEDKLVQEYGRAEEFRTQLLLRPELNITYGMAAMHAKEFAIARTAFRNALDPKLGGNKDDARAQTLIGVAYYQDARSLLIDEGALYQGIEVLTAAAREVEKVVKNSPQYGPAHTALGDIYMLQAETYVSSASVVSHTYPEAEAEFRQAVQLLQPQPGQRADPQYVDALVGLARSLSAQQRYNEAISELNRALAVNPQRADLHAELAWAYVGLGRLELALEEANVALQLDKNQVIAYNAAGLAAYYKQDFGTAIENFQRAIDIDPTAHQSHTNLGLAFFQMRSWTRARHEFQRALERIPEAVVTGTALQRSYLYYLIGLTYSNTGAHEQAIEAVKQALAIDGNYLDALRQLARDHVALGNFEAAARALRAARQQSPDPILEAEVLAQLGTVYESAGQPHEALAAYAEAISKDPQNLDAQNGFARLQNL